MKHLGGLDAAFLAAETPSMHLHVVGVVLLDAAGAPEGWTPDVVTRLVEERLPLLPPFRWQLAGPAAGIDRPRWMEAPGFDLSRHVHRATLAPPGGLGDLERFVGEVASTPLDRARPLWELHVVDGMADGSVAVVTKLHHSFMDGGAGSAVMASLFDLDPGHTAGPVVDTWEPEAPPTVWERARSTGAAPLERAARLPSTVLRSVRAARPFLDAMFPERRGGRGLFAPPTSFNAPLTPTRSVAMGRASLEQVKQTRSALGCTVNDVVLAAVAGALRRALVEDGYTTDRPLVAAVPVSVRSDAGMGDFDNRTSVVMVPLPTDLADPSDRLADVAARATAAKGHHADLGPDLIESWTRVLPPWVISAGSAVWSGGLARFVSPPANLVVSNVPGPPVPLYLAGCRVSATYPLGPLIEGSGLNVTILSQCDDLDIGVTACPDLVPDPHRVVDGITECFDELAGIAGIESTAPMPTPSRSRR